MTTGKRQAPFWLDMNFSEALERFAQTDPKELASETKAAGIQPAAKMKVRGKRKRLVQPVHDKRADTD